MVKKEAIALGPHEFGALLENIQSQQHAMLEAIQAMGDRLNRTMEERFASVEARLDMLESVVRQNSGDINALREDVRSLRKDLEKRDERLSAVEDRVATLEKRLTG
jgi:chromosome segregation ATPase